MALTAKGKAFAQAVADGMSNKDAAISAGYSEKTAMQQGAKLSKNPEWLECTEDAAFLEIFQHRKDSYRGSLQGTTGPTARRQSNFSGACFQRCQNEFSKENLNDLEHQDV